MRSWSSKGGTGQNGWRRQALSLVGAHNTAQLTPLKAAALTLGREQASLRDLRLNMRRSNHLSLLTLGLRVHESQESLVVTRSERCELHPDSLSTFRPPHDSLRT